MLVNISKQPKAGDVICVKLVDGEEIIARLENVSDDVYTIVRPVILHLVPLNNGQASVSFAPFSMGIDDETSIDIPFNRMLFKPVVARKDAASQYIRSTTGIDVVSKV